MKTFLRFVAKKTEGKTKCFEVYSTHSEDYLGSIHWRSGWRCYVMSYDMAIDMSLSCQKELVAFMDNLENERKKEVKE